MRIIGSFEFVLSSGGGVLDFLKISFISVTGQLPEDALAVVCKMYVSFSSKFEFLAVGKLSNVTSKKG